MRSTGSSALAEHSLIARDQTPIGDAGRLAGSGVRFALLKTVHGYALDRLIADGREGELRRRHAVAYLELAETAERHLLAAEQPAWIDRLALDQANLRAALRWSIDAGEAELALRFVAASWRYWQVVGQLAEGSDWAEAAIAMPGADAPTIARVRALGAAGQHRVLAVGARAGGRALPRAAGPCPTTEGHGGHGRCLVQPGLGDLCGRRPRRIRRRASRRRDVCMLELGDERGVNRCDWGIDEPIMETEGPAAMLVALQPVLERAIALGDAAYVVLCGGSMAWATFMLGDMTSAARWGIQSMLASYGMRDVAGSTIALPIAAIVAIEFGHADDAALIMGAFEGLCERYGVRPPIGLEQLIRSTDPGVRLQGIMAPTTLEAALERGRRMTIDEAMDVVVRIADAVPPDDRDGLDGSRRSRLSRPERLHAVGPQDVRPVRPRVRRAVRVAMPDEPARRSISASTSGTATSTSAREPATSSSDPGCRRAATSPSSTRTRTSCATSPGA